MPNMLRLRPMPIDSATKQPDPLGARVRSRARSFLAHKKSKASIHLEPSLCSQHKHEDARNMHSLSSWSTSHPLMTNSILGHFMAF